MEGAHRLPVRRIRVLAAAPVREGLRAVALQEIQRVQAASSTLWSHALGLHRQGHRGQGLNRE